MKKKLYTHTDGRKNFFTYLGMTGEITDNRQINKKKNILPMQDQPIIRWWGEARREEDRNHRTEGSGDSCFLGFCRMSQCFRSVFPD